MSRFVLLGGRPGSGRRTLAAGLATAPGLPLLAAQEIDEIKEAIGPPAVAGRIRAP